VGGKEEEHPEGAYYLYHTKQWIGVGADALEAQHSETSGSTRKNSSGCVERLRMQKATVEPTFGKNPLAVAADRYFSNLEARGSDPKTIRTYRTGVDPFVETCTRTHIEDVTKQDMIDFMGSLRKQPLTKRRNSNPNRTYANKVGTSQSS